MVKKNNYLPKYSNTLLCKKNNSVFYRIYYLIMSKPFFHRHKTKFKYISVSLLGEIIDFTILYVFTSILGIFYLFSATISYISAVLFNFLLNQKYTFKFKPKDNIDFFKAMAKCFTISLSSMIVNLVLLAFTVEFFHLNYMLAKLIVSLVLSVFVYLFYSSILKNKK
jgi:putative flippase GtrA